MVEKVRTIIVDLSKRFGGASTRTITLARGLKSWGVAICGLADSPVVEMAKKNGIPVVEVGRSRLNPLIPFRLASYIRKGKYQLLDTQNIQSKFWGSIAALLSNSTLVSTLNSWYVSEHGGKVRGRIYTAIDLYVNWKTKRYIVVSETVRNELSSSGIAKDNIDLIRNAVEIKNSFVLTRSGFRKELGIPNDAVIAVAVGRLVRVKGFDNFISAVARVAETDSNVFAIIIGGGALFNSLNNQIKKLGLSKRIFLLGFQARDEVLNILHCCDIFVMPSRSEASPFALLEAAALGLPIIATNCGGIPEIVVDKKEALLVPADDVISLASALGNLIENQNMADTLGNNAMKRIQQEYSVSYQIAATKRSYLKAMK